jgi:multimeric flavodoxin WrbA
MSDLQALALICTLKSGSESSSTQLLADQVLAALEREGVGGQSIRIADFDVRPGVDLDEGDGDEWPSIRSKLIDADILVLATPTWLGQPSSICQRVLERLDAELSEKDDEGRLLTYGKVAIAVVVGNEDGAHHISAIVFQALNDVGFTLAPGAVSYWNGEAMHRVDYKDLPATPDEVAKTTRSAAANAAHLAKILRAAPFPPAG